MTTVNPVAMRASMKAWRAAGFITVQCKPNTKDQYSKTAARYHGNCTTDPAQVDKLWRGKFAECNGAIKCPPGHVIVDIDPRNGGMQAALRLGLLDANGNPTGGAYWQTTRDNGRRIIYTLPNGLGRGLKHSEPEPGLELTFEASHSVVLVAPSIVEGRPYVAHSDVLSFTPAPDCIVKFTYQLHAKHAPRPAAPGNLAPAPQSIKTRYADATLNALCDDLRGALNGTRHLALRRAACRMGSICAACGIGTSAAAERFEAVTAEWKDPAKVKATIESGLAKGVLTPAEIDWKHGTAETFQRAGALVLKYLQSHKWAGTMPCKRGNVTTASAMTIATAMAEYSQTRHLFGAFVISQRTLQTLTGCMSETVQNAISGLLQDNVIAIVGRDELAYIKTAGTDAAQGDKRLQARCYAFNLAEMGRRMSTPPDTNDTVKAYGGRGEALTSYELYFPCAVTVSSVSADVFSRVALGRSAGAILVKLLANPAGLTHEALAESTGLHERTIQRNIGRLLQRGLVDREGEYSRAVDADAIQAALATVADECDLHQRRATRGLTIQAERAAHSLYVQSRRAGIGEIDAQRAARHEYNATRYPNGMQDKIDADGVIHPANPNSAPAPGIEATAWPHLVANAQAERDTAVDHAQSHTPAPMAPTDAAALAKAVAVFNELEACAATDTPAPAPAPTDAERMAQAVAAFNDWNAPTPARPSPAPRRPKPKPAPSPATQPLFELPGNELLAAR